MNVGNRILKKMFFLGNEKMKIGRDFGDIHISSCIF
jgi:hypothetical protein